MATAFMLPSKLNNWAFETVPQPGLDGRRGYQPRGRALGGSSAINAMIYTRGHRVDYDHWASLGNAGWSYAEVLPYFRKSEGNEVFADEYHGTSGPLNVAMLRSDNPFQAHFLAAAQELQIPLNKDFNGARQEGLGVYQVTQKNGERWSAARAFLDPVRSRPNLHVMTGVAATKLIFEARRAVAVDFVRGGEKGRVGARAEIILSAGAFQTPQLLMLSGIGNAAELKAQNVDLVLHLPGVGQNLQDHIDYVFVYRATNADLFGLSAKGLFRLAREIGRYRRERRGMVTSNFAECGGFLRSRPDLEAPDLQLHFVVGMVDDHSRKKRLGHGFSCHVCLLRPQSRGTVALASPDPAAPPRIDPQFYAHPDDLETMVQGFKITRRLMDAPALAQHRSADLYTADVQTDDDIRAALRRRSDTVYHPVGTCRMGVDSAAVVDPQLRVVGVAGLRIADASIMPTLVGGNTNAPSIMIGEKAADMIRAA
jgi:choline dehydrogenase-like flavoprotein